MDGAYCVKSVEFVGTEYQGDYPVRRIINAQLDKIANGIKKEQEQRKKLRKRLAKARSKIPFKDEVDD